MINYWLDRSMALLEEEVLLVKSSPNLKKWFDKMPKALPACYSEVQVINDEEDYGPKVGLAHHLKLTKFGVEGVLKVARKYHRLERYVYYNANLRPKDPFWVVIHKNKGSQ